MISIVMPAHNEEQVIRRTLEAFVHAADAGEIEVLVVCNGCCDATADIARSFGPTVRAIETDTASKANALNLGDACATSFPRVYMDADVEMSMKSLRQLTSPLADGRLLAAAPSVETTFRKGADWSVRAYYSFWMALPFVQEGMMAAGVYAVSAEGRRRFEKFPEIIADDGYFRLHFTSDERAEVKEAISKVYAPARIADLIRIKTRSRLGVYQLGQLYPDLFEREKKSKRHSEALIAILKQPRLYIQALPFLLVSVISRRRAARQLSTGKALEWERDLSSRAA